MDNRVIVLAHRGASAEAPESTRAAILRARTLKADGIELDVQLTRDDRLVVFHDARLERTTNGRGRMTAQRYAQLSRLDAGSWFAPRFAGERILLVSQALRLFPSGLVNLELKRTRRPAILIRQLLRCLRRTRSSSRVLISSFDASLLACLHASAPRIAQALLCARHPARSLRTAQVLGCFAWHPRAAVVTAARVAQAHAAGCRVHAWTVDRPAEARRLMRLGVDGLFTNRPGRLRPVCRTSPGGRA